MASGLEGQRFCFHGYITIDKTERMKKIQRMEEAAKTRKETQLFIETPYRNNQVLSDLLQHQQNYMLVVLLLLILII